VEKLGALTEDEAGAETVEARGATTARVLEILRVQRTDAGGDARMFGVREHGAEQQLHMFREPFAERGSEGKSKIGLIQMTTAAKANGFIKVDTEHRVRRFKKAQSVKVGNRLLRGEGGTPTL
jgi:hypothetical protein